MISLKSTKKDLLLLDSNEFLEIEIWKKKAFSKLEGILVINAANEVTIITYLKKWKLNAFAMYILYSRNFTDTATLQSICGKARNLDFSYM